MAQQSRTDSTQAFRITDAETSDVAFMRQTSRFRNWVTADGFSGLAPEFGRYHLYVARACPWAHRTIIGRKLMGLEDAISISFVDPIRDERGWAFTQAGRYEDQVNDFHLLSEAYLASAPDFDQRVTVPVLWDKLTGKIVNNESADILRMLSTVFATLAKHPVELYPRALATEIDALNEQIYDPVNNGVYRAGFATSQAAYDQAVTELFQMLQILDERLASTRFLFGPTPLETDIRLFTTLIRFDAVYNIHFKCSLHKLAEYRHLWPYVRDIYQWQGISETVSFDEIRAHYYRTHTAINPHGIVAVMPGLDFNAPPGREGL